MALGVITIMDTLILERKDEVEEQEADMGTTCLLDRAMEVAEEEQVTLMAEEEEPPRARHLRQRKLLNNNCNDRVAMPP